MKGLEDFIPCTLTTTQRKTRFSGPESHGKDPLLGHRSDSATKLPTGARRRVQATETAESRENHSEQMYRPLGDRLGPAELVQAAYKQ